MFDVILLLQLPFENLHHFHSNAIDTGPSLSQFVGYGRCHWPYSKLGHTGGYRLQLMPDAI